MSRDTTDKRSIVKRALPEYKLLSEAPDKVPYEWDTSDESREAWMNMERKNRYKASNNDGDILLVMNPFVWEEKDFIENVKGVIRKWKAKYRPKPEIVLSYNDACKQAGEKF